MTVEPTAMRAIASRKPKPRASSAICELVTGNLFTVLGVTPLLGRNIRAEDDSVAAAPVVAISYELWQRRYGADPSALGRVLMIRGQAATIVAVMPRGFGFPAQLGIEIVRGRAFTEEDSAEGRQVLIVNESAATLAWPHNDAVGERMRVADTWATVVGVAADTRYRELTAIRPTVYRPRAQFEAAPGFLAVRTTGDPIALAPAIRRAGQAVSSPSSALTQLEAMVDDLSDPDVYSPGPPAPLPNSLARSRDELPAALGLLLLQRTGNPPKIVAVRLREPVANPTRFLDHRVVGHGVIPSVLPECR